MSAQDSWLKETGETTWANPRVRVLVAVLAVIGVALLLWSPGQTGTAKNSDSLAAALHENDASSIEKQLDTALSGIEGAGTVKTEVNLVSDGLRTYASNERKEVRKTQEKDPNGTTRSITEENLDHELVMANNSPVLEENLQPRISGVLVIAEGASDPAVAESLSQAVTGLLNISPARVAVMPMSTGGDQ